MNDIRKKIDFIDEKILKLFETRLELVYNILKIKNNIKKPILDGEREKEIFKRIYEFSSKKYVKYNICLFKKILDISKKFQYYKKLHSINFPGNNYKNKLKIIKCKDYHSLKKLIEKKFLKITGAYSIKIEYLKRLKKFYFYIIIK